MCTSHSSHSDYYALIESRSGRYSSLLLDEIRIGRSRDNDIVLTGDLTVSRRQAVVVREGDHYFLEDLSSTNGTLLNGRAVNGRIKLQQDDVLSIGRTTFIFSKIAFAVEDPDEVPTVTIPGRAKIASRIGSMIAACVAKLFAKQGTKMPEARRRPSSAGCYGQVVADGLMQYQKNKGIAKSGLQSK
ncbi:MAG TPA: FHA domain-containing protein [Candidatus Obscuribacterales bacterium]